MVTPNLTFSIPTYMKLTQLKP